MRWMPTSLRVQDTGQGCPRTEDVSTRKAAAGEPGPRDAGGRSSRDHLVVLSWSVSSTGLRVFRWSPALRRSAASNCMVIVGGRDCRVGRTRPLFPAHGDDARAPPVVASTATEVVISVYYATIGQAAVCWCAVGAASLLQSTMPPRRLVRRGRVRHCTGDLFSVSYAMVGLHVCLSQSLSLELSCTYKNFAARVQLRKYCGVRDIVVWSSAVHLRPPYADHQLARSIVCGSCVNSPTCLVVDDASSSPSLRSDPLLPVAALLSQW